MERHKPSDLLQMFPRTAKEVGVGGKKQGLLHKTE